MCRQWYVISNKLFVFYTDPCETFGCGADVQRDDKRLCRPGYIQWNPMQNSDRPDRYSQGFCVCPPNLVQDDDECVGMHSCPILY